MAKEFFHQMAKKNVIWKWIFFPILKFVITEKADSGNLQICNGMYI